MSVGIAHKHPLNETLNDLEQKLDLAISKETPESLEEWLKTNHSPSPKIKHRYSGKKSQKFWDIVNSIENEADRQELYSLGVMLQNSEEYVLRQLSNLNVCTVTKD